MTGYAEPTRMDALGFSPLTTRDTLLGGIRHEISLARAGKPAHIWLKMNSLVDNTLIDALHRAPACRWGQWYAAYAVCALVWPDCRRTSASSRLSAASWNTAASACSATVIRFLIGRPACS